MIATWWIQLRRSVGRLISGQSLQWRLAALTGVSVAATVLLVGATGFMITRWSLFNQLDRDLTRTAQQAANVLVSDMDNLDALTAETLGSSGSLISVVSANGTADAPATQTVTIPNDHAEIAIARLQSETRARTVIIDNVEYRAVTVPFSVTTERSVEYYSVTYARPTETVRATLSSLWGVMLASGSLGILVTTLAALWTARAALAPVRRLSTTLVWPVRPTPRTPPVSSSAAACRTPARSPLSPALWSAWPFPCSTFRNS